MPETPNARPSSADDAIAALKPSFLNSLKTQLAELKKHRENIVGGAPDEKLRQAMRFTVHALRGTAASHFFPEIPKAAGPLERAIIAGDPLTEDGFLAGTDDLIELCASALAEEERAA